MKGIGKDIVVKGKGKVMNYDYELSEKYVDCGCWIACDCDPMCKVESCLCDCKVGNPLVPRYVAKNEEGELYWIR